MKKILILLILLLSGISVLAGCNGASKTGTSPEGKEVPIETASINLMKDVMTGGYDVVDTATLKGWLADKKDQIVVIDTMPADKYKENHIDGAVNSPLPLTLSETKDDEKAALLKIASENKDKIFVVYCGFTSCTRSHVGAMLLKEAGVPNVYRYPGGIVAWKE